MRTALEVAEVTAAQLEYWSGILMSADQTASKWDIRTEGSWVGRTEGQWEGQSDEQ